MRWLAWCWDPDPTDSSYIVDYAFLLREADGSVTVEQDRHVEGLFSRAAWLETMTSVGCEARMVPCPHSELEPGSYELFVGIKPKS